jgi:hypothetical protein
MGEEITIKTPVHSFCLFLSHFELKEANSFTGAYSLWVPTSWWEVLQNPVMYTASQTRQTIK